MKKIILVICFSTAHHYAMEKPPMNLASEPEPQFWATKKSHEKNKRRVKEEYAQEIDLDALAQKIHYYRPLALQTELKKTSRAPYEIPKEWYYGRKINTLLLNACTDDRNSEIVKQLLAHNANPNVKIDRTVVWANPKVMIGEFVETPLLTAIQHQAEKNVELLLQAGARVTTLQGLQLETVLHYACSSKDSSPETKKNIISLLLAHGANPNATNLTGENCFYSLIASGSWNQLHIPLLLEYGLDARTKFPRCNFCISYLHEQICNVLAKYARPMALFRVLWKRAQNSDFKRLPRELALQISELVYNDSKLPQICTSQPSKPI